MIIKKIKGFQNQTPTWPFQTLKKNRKNNELIEMFMG